MNIHRLETALIELVMCGDIGSARRALAFEQAGVLTGSRGLVLTMDDGAEFQITIVQSKPAKATVDKSVDDWADDIEEDPTCVTAAPSKIILELIHQNMGQPGINTHPLIRALNAEMARRASNHSL